MNERRRLRGFWYLHKILSTKPPTYVYELIQPILNSHGNAGCYKALYCRTDLFLNTFLPLNISGWNKLDPNIRNLDSHKMFCKKLLTFKRPSEKSIYNIHNAHGSKPLYKLRLCFSHLCEHNFRHNFADIVNPLCSRPLETESTEHLFLRCQDDKTL